MLALFAVSLGFLFESSAPFICYGRGEETCWNIETIIMKTDIPVGQFGEIVLGQMMVSF